MMDAKTAVRRLGAWLGAVAGAGVLLSNPATARAPATPTHVPAAWMRYAEAATLTIKAWLEAKTETATRVRAYIAAMRPTPDQPPPPHQLKIWISPDGTVSRIDVPPFADEQANTDLRAALVGRKLAGPPPRRMRQPLRMEIEIDPVPPEGEAKITSAIYPESDVPVRKIH